MPLPTLRLLQELCKPSAMVWFKAVKDFSNVVIEDTQTLHSGTNNFVLFIAQTNLVLNDLSFAKSSLMLEWGRSRQENS